MVRRLQEMRRAAGFRSAREFAEALGVPVRTYTNYEQGSHVPPLDLLIRMADMLGCTLDELVGREPDGGETVVRYRQLSDEAKKAVDYYVLYISDGEAGR